MKVIKFRFYEIQIVVAIIVSSCSWQKDTTTYELKVINDVFLELIRDRHVYQDIDAFKEDYYSKGIDSISQDSMNVYYNQYRKVLIYGTLMIEKNLVPLSSDEKNLLVLIDKDHQKVQYNILDDEISIDLGKIVNVGQYKVILADDSDSTVDVGISSIRFSRVNFNNTMDKAAFSFEIICGELCYSRSLIFVNKNEDGKWIIYKGYPIEIS